MSRRPKQPRRRKGNVLLLSAVLMVVLMAMVAFAVDLGYLCVARNELQRSADSSAIAACWDLVNQDAPAGYVNVTAMDADARATAATYASLNQVMRQGPALATSDVEVGYIANPHDPSSPFIAGTAITPNAVRVHVQRTDTVNGKLPLFFGRVLGVNEASSDASATAAVVYSFRGFESPSDGTNLGILPFALDEDTWNAMLAGAASDNYSYDPDTGGVTLGPDGIKEVNLYPQGTGIPGNRGTVDIGSSNNSTADIKRQILNGISDTDMDYMGGKLEFNDDGILFLNGDTGISAAVKDELATIKGEPKIIPVFRSVENPGNNATYSIVSFVGIRVLHVDLTGSISTKQVIIQPSVVLSKGGLVDEDGDGQTQYIYSPVWLVR